MRRRDHEARVTDLSITSTRQSTPSYAEGEHERASGGAQTHKGRREIRTCEERPG
jgi:hypothetical protein